jgi:hypothetical protein
MKLRSSASTSVATKVDSAAEPIISVSKQKSNQGKHSVDVSQPADQSGYSESSSNDSEEGTVKNDNESKDAEHGKAVREVDPLSAVALPRSRRHRRQLCHLP